MNKVLTGGSTTKNKENLIKEDIIQDIYITGNIVIDAIRHIVKLNYTFKNSQLQGVDFSNRKYILMTAHRRENLREPLVNICRAVKRLVEDPDDLNTIYLVHLNTSVKETVNLILGLGDTKRVYRTCIA